MEPAVPPAAAAPCVVGGRVAGTGGSGGGDLEAALAAAAAHAARLVGASYDRASAETPRTSNSGTGTETCTDPLEQPINMGHVVGLSSHSSPLSPYHGRPISNDEIPGPLHPSSHVWRGMPGAGPGGARLPGSAMHDSRTGSVHRSASGGSTSRVHPVARPLGMPYVMCSDNTAISTMMMVGSTPAHAVVTPSTVPVWLQTCPPPDSSRPYLVTQTNTVRMEFLRKVFSILLMQLVFTFTVAATFVRVERVRNYVKSTPTLLWLSVAICALLLIIFFTNKRTMRVHPINVVMLLLFTLFMSFIIGFVCAHFEFTEVLLSLGTVTTVTLSLIIYATVSKKYEVAFTRTRGTVVIIVALALFVVLFGVAGSTTTNLAISASIAFVVSCFILIWTHRIVGGDKAGEFTIEDYVVVSLTLYISFLSVFVVLLSLCACDNE